MPTNGLSATPEDDGINVDLSDFLDNDNKGVELISVGNSQNVESKSSFGGIRKVLLALTITVAGAASYNVTAPAMSGFMDKASVAYASANEATELFTANAVSTTQSLMAQAKDSVNSFFVKSDDLPATDSSAQSTGQLNAKSTVKAGAQASVNETLQPHKARLVKEVSSQASLDAVENSVHAFKNEADSLGKSAGVIYSKLLDEEALDGVGLGPTTGEMKFFERRYLKTLASLDDALTEATLYPDTTKETYEELKAGLDILSSKESELVIYNISEGSNDRTLFTKDGIGKLNSVFEKCNEVIDSALERLQLESATSAIQR